jgi:glycosyltransferase involved in cell wall biosynthesis
LVLHLQARGADLESEVVGDVARHPTGGVANPVLTGGDGTMTIETPDSVRDQSPAPGADEGAQAEGLRIAMVAPPWFELPPSGYGGIESVVADLVDELTGRGHHVTLIGAGRNGTAAEQFLPVFDAPPSERLGTPGPEVIHAAATARLLDDLEVDVVHDHSFAGPLLARGRAVPTVVTMHGPVGGEYGEYFGWLGDCVDVVAISDAQRRLNPELNWVGRVHNAIAVDSFPFRADKDDYLLWLGRFSPDKGPDLAIDAARAAGMRIVLAGKRSEPVEKAFFDAEIAPRLGPGVEHVGEADATQKRELLAGARALVFPLQWEEPFGMVMIEAMACGTPVVALPRGSVPEVVVHGVTGLVVDDFERFPAALRAAESIDPAACRAHVVAHFDLPVMAAGYERIYRMLVAGERSVEALTSRRRTMA